MVYYRRRTYRKRRTYKRKSRGKTTYKRRTYRKRTYRRKSGSDKGTFLKVSSSALPVVIQNKSSSQGDGYELTPDTFQTGLRFRMGNTEGGESIIINNEIKSATGSRDPELMFNDIYVGSKDLLTKYTNLYKYMQVYKIVVKFIPTITEGGVISTTPGAYLTNAINGMVTTDIDSGDYQSPYIINYPPTVDGNAKANSRKVSRETRITKGWTRTFTPKQYIQSVVPNPKAKYQYKPEYNLETGIEEDNQLILSGSTLIIRMRKPQLAGFTATNIEGTEIDYPEAGSFVRYGTLMVHAYVKFRSPLF